MDNQNYTAGFMVNMPAAKVFENINNVPKWWTADLKGGSHNTNDEFTVQFADKHLSTQKVIELVPGKKVVWQVTDSALSFVRDQQEWNNTTIHFDIEEKNGQSQLKFTHVGLNPTVECFNGCSKGWDYYIKGSLFKLLTEGKGTPGL